MPGIHTQNKHASHRTSNVLVEQRNARLPVTQEVAGSNPVGNAFNNMARYANKAERPGSNPGGWGFESLACYCRNLPRVVLLAAACKAAVIKEAWWPTRGSIPSRPTVVVLLRSTRFAQAKEFTWIPIHQRARRRNSSPVRWPCCELVSSSESDSRTRARLWVWFWFRCRQPRLGRIRSVLSTCTTARRIRHHRVQSRFEHADPFVTNSGNRIDSTIFANERHRLVGCAKKHSLPRKSWPT